MTTMLTWQADGRPGLEGARVHFGPAPSGFRALGRIVRPDPAGDLTASYSVVVREDGTLGRLSLNVATTGYERHLTMQRTDEGLWLLDDGAGSERADFDGAVDVDLVFSPMFTALPIRRLRAHREPVDVEVRSVLVSLPDLRVAPVVQRYRTVRVLDGDVPALIALEVDGLDAVLEVDSDGFVVSYPGVASLVSNERAEPAGQV